MIHLRTWVSIVLLVWAAQGTAAGKVRKQNESTLDEYLARVQRIGGSLSQGASPGSLWTANGLLTSISSDYKARQAGDIVVINIVEQTLAEASGAVTSQRAFDTNSAITGLAGRINTGGVNPLFTANSATKLQGQAQAASNSRLRTSVAGQVVAVLPGGNLVVEARRELVMNNERQTILLRGIARPGDISPDDVVPSTLLSNLEIELHGKGVISDATRRPNWVLRALLRLITF